MIRPASVGDHARHGVEGNPRQRHALVADRAEDQPHGHGAAAASGLRTQAAVLALVELVVDHRQRLDPLAADDLHRRDEEVKDDPSRRAAGRPGGVVAQDLEVAVAGAVRRGGQARLELGGQLEVGGVDDHVNAWQLAELLELLVGEGGLGGPAPAQHVDLTDAALGQLREGVLGDVGGRQQLCRAGQDAGEVHRHVAVSDHGGALGRQVEAEVAEVRVGVVPAHELGGRVAAGQMLAGDAHAPVRARADGVDDRVVVGRSGPRGSGRGPSRRCRRSGTRGGRRSCRRRASPT